MKSLKTGIFAAAMLVLPLAVYAGGGGGLTWGEQYFASSALSNTDLQTSTAGVYGYGVTRGSQRVGGFAMAIHTTSPMQAMDGGFVGAIAGQEMRAGPFTAALDLWTGFGGLAAIPALGTSGAFALFGELSLELGLTGIPGVMLTGYAGMQAIAAVQPDQALFGKVMYTPVIGMRLAWGSF
jgi:hypothetical protein